MSYFDKAIEQLLGRIEIEGDGEEGGYVNDPNDAGGETKFGITKRYYPELDIKNLTEQQAREIYRRDYWDRMHLDDIENEEIAVRMFSFAVNMGIVPAIRCLQRACRACGYYVKDDGIFGPNTNSAVRRSDQQSLLAALKSEAAGHYRYVVAIKPSNRKYLEGWLSRAYR